MPDPAGGALLAASPVVTEPGEGAPQAQGLTAAHGWHERSFVRGGAALPARGMQALPDQLAASLEVDYEVRVDRITEDGVVAGQHVAPVAQVEMGDPARVHRPHGLLELAEEMGGIWGWKRPRLARSLSLASRSS